MSVSITPTPDKPKRRLRVGLAASLIIHSCLLGALVVIPYRIYVANQGEKDTSHASSSAGKGSASGEKGAADEEKNSATHEYAAPADKVMTAKVDDELRRSLAEAESLPDDEKLARLEQLAGKLDQVSSEKSVDELSKKFQAWLKTEERATAPAEKPPEGEFDYGTAQFHDVKREETAEGGFVYKSVLLDAAGRTVEIEMAAAEGESTYHTL